MTAVSLLRAHTRAHEDPQTPAHTAMNSSEANPFSVSGFPLQICAKLERYFLNVNKTQNEYETTAIPFEGMSRGKNMFSPLALAGLIPL